MIDVVGNTGVTVLHILLLYCIPVYPPPPLSLSLPPRQWPCFLKPGLRKSDKPPAHSGHETGEVVCFVNDGQHSLEVLTGQHREAFGHDVTTVLIDGDSDDERTLGVVPGYLLAQKKKYWMMQ